MHSTCTRLLVMDITKPEVPRDRMRRTRPAWSTMADSFSFRMARRPVRNFSTHAAEHPWEITVAMAAPRTPISRPKIKMGSSTMFTSAPTVTVTMPILLNPWALIKGFIPRPIITKTVPRM